MKITGTLQHEASRGASVRKLTIEQKHTTGVPERRSHLSILNPRKETMKIRLLFALVGSAISLALPIFAQQTNTPATDKVRFKFQDITNANDPTFNQELGIDNAGEIVGYLGSGAAGHPNKGYTDVTPHQTQLSFTNEKFPASAQTQIL